MKKKILNMLPRPLAHQLLYQKVLGKKLNLKNPKDFNEKIQYMLVYQLGRREAKLADKYLVREFIKEKGFSFLLPKLYGVYDRVEDIDITKLPDKFVLKPNNGSGNIHVCRDKSTFDFAKAKKELQKTFTEKFWEVNLEHHYKFIKPKIICEEYLEDPDRPLPMDYKFYCYDGHVECVLMCTNRSEKLKLDYYDLNWHYLEYAKKEYRSHEEIQKPEHLEEMIHIASSLSKGFSFVRVDLYHIKGKIYFGEMTFTPMAGLVYYNTDEALEHLGKLIQLKGRQKE